MEPKYSFLCEAANHTDSGNLNVLGIFQNITVKDFPVTIPRIFYAACIAFHRSETGTHQFKISFVDDDGHAVVPPLEQETIVYEDNLYAYFLWGIENIQFYKAGTYAVDLFIDNQHIVSDTIRIHKVSPDRV